MLDQEDKALQLRIREAVQAAYPNASLEFEVYPGGRIGGTVITDQFGELDLADRQRVLWKIFRSALAEESTRLTTFLTFTPDEDREMRQVMAA